METTFSPLRQQLETLSQTYRFRRLREIARPVRPGIEVDGKKLIDFCSNDYLGFSQHPRLIQAAQEASRTYGTGTGGSRLIGGTLDIHLQLERQLARFKSTEAALVFNSGYQANLGVLSALVHRDDLIFADRLNHASLIDGAILSRAKLIRYPHLDLAALEKRLQQSPPAKQKFIVTDTVFSMDGDLAPLETLFQLAQQYDAWLILDEAHATGLFGDTHRSGLWETMGIGPSPRVVQIGTFSKALGSFGAYVAASRDIIDALVQLSRSFIYSTALPPGVIGANMAALDLVETDAVYCQTLWENLRYFQHYAASEGLHPPVVQSPIIPVLLGDSATTLQAAESLFDAGFFVQAIRPPTVPEGTSRLRMTINRLHTHQQIEQLVQALKGLPGWTPA